MARLMRLCRHPCHPRPVALININEAGIKDFSGALGKLKSLVTEPFVSIRAMYQDVMVIPSYHRFILTTNETYAIAFGELLHLQKIGE